MNTKYKKVTLYPFNGEFTAFVAYLNRHSDIYRITELVSPKCLGISGKDAGVIYNKPNVGLIVSDDFNQAMKNSEVLMIAENKFNESFRQTIINNINIAIENKKDIICTMKLFNEELELFKKLSAQFEISFTYCPEETVWNSVKDTICVQSRKLYTPQAVVVFVGELLDGIDGFDVLLSVTDYFKSSGFKTLAIGDRSYCELLGLLSLPSILTQTDVNDDEKINYLNHYIEYLDKHEKPDVFVIQLPGAMMKYNDHFTNGFGITPYLISQAVQGDYFILCTHYNIIDIEFYKMLSNNFTHRFGFEIDCIHMSNAYIDFSNSKEQSKLSYLYIEQELLNNTINQYYKKSEIPIYNIENISDRNKMFRQLYEVFSYDYSIHHIV